MEDFLIVNQNKNETITVEDVTYSRLCIKTHVITHADNIVEVADKYAYKHLKQGDILFITEKTVACTQKRAIPIKDIKPRRLAKILSKFVVKNSYGIGLAMPETMEIALRKCGTAKILFAALCGAIGKLFGKRGVFYVIAGEQTSAIDGPASYNLPPYNEYVVLAPINANEVAKKVYEKVDHPVLITDMNDIGGRILGKYPPTLDTELYMKILKDNPLGQSTQQTPLGIIRAVKS